MTRDRTELTSNRFMAGAATKRPAHQSLGAWNGDSFTFHSPRHEREWRGQAYRQSVHADRWHAQAPVDQQTQTMLDGMPELGSGQYFLGPDGKHRRKTMELREDGDVQEIRRSAFNAFARTGVTWSDLDAYGDDRPHPGEEQAIAIGEAKARAKAVEAQSKGPNKLRDMGALPKDRNAITQVAGDLGLNLALPTGAKDSAAVPTTPPPVLVATTDRAVASSALKGLVPELPVGTPKKLAPTPKVRRDFVEGLVGRAANDNAKPQVATGVTTSPSPEGASLSVQPSVVNKPNVGRGMSDEDVAEAEYMDGLFNWRRQGKPAPAPRAYAIHTATDEGRFNYLEDMKNEWSRLLASHPEEVFQSMTGEVEKLSHAAQQDFFTAYHREANAQEVAEINGTLAEIVFAPAEHWAGTGVNPNDRVGEIESKPFLGFIIPEKISGLAAVDALVQASKEISSAEAGKLGGRLGSQETRDMTALMTQKLADAIEKCGGDIVATYHGESEPLIRQHSDYAKGGRYPDASAVYRYNGKQVGVFTNHAGTWADGRTLQANEARQIEGLVRNLARAVGEGDLGIEIAGVGYFPKRKPDQSKEDYLKAMDDFISQMIDCGKPFLIKVNAARAPEPLDEPANDNLPSSEEEPLP